MKFPFPFYVACAAALAVAVSASTTSGSNLAFVAAPGGPRGFAVVGRRIVRKGPPSPTPEATSEPCFLLHKITHNKEDNHIPVSLPDPEEWPTRPVLFTFTDDTKVDGYEPGQSLPLGKPIEFESSLFVGKVLLRLRSVKPSPDDASQHAAYFDGKKRFYQILLQGRFKEKIPMSDAVMGAIYEKPFNGLPKGYFMKLLQMFMQTLNPSMLFDIVSDKPKVLAPFSLTQVMNISEPGKEPDITALDSVVEDTTIIHAFKSPAQRKMQLPKKKYSSIYYYDPAYVYTFHNYGHSMDFGTYQQTVFGGLKVDLTKTLNGQPLSMSALRRSDEQMIYNFPVWHEKLIEAM